MKKETELVMDAIGLNETAILDVDDRLESLRTDLSILVDLLKDIIEYGISRDQQVTRIKRIQTDLATGPKERS